MLFLLNSITLVHLQKLVRGNPITLLGLGVLKIQVILSVLEELAGSNIHAYLIF